MTEWETTQDRVEMIHKAAKEQNYLDSMEYDEKVGHAQYLDRKEALRVAHRWAESFEPTPLNTLFGFDSEGKSVVFGGHAGESIWAKHIVLDKSGAPLNLDRKPTKVHMLRDAREYALKKLIDEKALRDRIRKSIDHFLNAETRLYNAGGLPVELTLPKGEHEAYFQNTLNYIMLFGSVSMAQILSNIDAFREAATYNAIHLDVNK